jgi:two-component system sensor histidine kinase KdpD
MARGQLRIYLGAAPGVGKTFAMLNEGWRGRARGKDVVIAFVETHGRANTAAQLHDLEIVSRKTLTYRGSTLEEMDVDAVLARAPQLALVDELAHTNAPGSRNEKRWQDVEELLDAGIDVVTTVNVQHLESVNDVVEQITGVQQHETVPDAIVRAAEQVELVDMTPEAIRRRMAHGNIYPAERVDAALANYFRPGNLAALRELALLWVADKVDENLHEYMADHGIAGTWETRERVVVALTGAPNADALIRRAARMARRTRGDLLGVHVRSTDGLATPPTDAMRAHRELLTQLGGEYHEIAGDDIGAVLVQFARAEHATQLVLGASHRSRWHDLVRGSVISRVLRDAAQIDVHVISYADADVTAAVETRRRGARHPMGPLSPRRRAAGWVFAVAGPLLLTLAMSQLRGNLSLPTELLLFLFVAVTAAALGGFGPALVASLGGFALANWYFAPPLHRWSIAEGENVAALLVFLGVAGVVSALVSAAARRAAEATRAKAEAATLAELSGALLGQPDPLGPMMTQLRSTFDVQAIAVLRGRGDGWVVETSAGEPVPQRPEDGQLSVPLDGHTQLVFVGPDLDEQDLSVLVAFTNQLALALESRELRAEAAMARGLAEANELRTALLAGVSHDLRTPLASIKAAATSLLQKDVTWTPDAVHELLSTIDEEADRLNALIGNLLDMSRIQTGSLQPTMRDVGLEEIVPLALDGLGERADDVVVDVPESLPRVEVDAQLLERAVANVVANALAFSPAGKRVRVEAGPVGDRVDVRVVDQGPGVPVAQREQMFRPFQRLGDTKANGNGVGLGLAVARGFVEAMGGQVTVDDTPGGGLTVVMSVKAAQS